MNTANVSVVIPAYNARRKIMPTLDSIFLQTTVPREVIIVDDGSTDGTYEYLHECQYPLVLRKQANSGPSSARNHGASIALGKWISFCDADDLWHKNKLEYQLATHSNHKNIYASFTNVSFVQNGTATGKIAAQETDKSSLEEILFLLGKEVLFPSTLLIRKRDFMSTGGFDENMRWAEDIDFVLRIVNTNKILFIGKVLVTHQIFNDSLSRSVNSEKGNLHLIKAWKTFLDSKETTSKLARRMARKHISRYFYDLAYDCDNTNQRKYYYNSWAYDKASVITLARYLRSYFFDHS